MLEGSVYTEATGDGAAETGGAGDAGAWRRIEWCGGCGVGVGGLLSCHDRPSTKTHLLHMTCANMIHHIISYD